MDREYTDIQASLRRNTLWQVAGRAIATALVTALSVWLFYQAALNQQKQRLVDITRSQVSLIRAMVLHEHTESHHVDGRAPQDPKALAIIQLRAAYADFTGIGQTGEFTLARQENGQIIFLSRHRHGLAGMPAPVPMASKLAEPMRRALRGGSGTLVGLDYRGEPVLAAYQAIPELGWGIVGKIDLAEVRRPYLMVGGIVVLLVSLVVATSAYFAVRSVRPFMATLEHSEARYRLLVENQNDLVVSFGPDLHLTFVSNAYCETFGHSREELLARPFMPLVHPEDQPAVQRSLQLVLSPPYRTSHEERAKTTAGWRWFQWSDRALLDDRGKVVEVVAVGRDITEHKEAEERRVETMRLLQQHAVFFDSALEAIAILDGKRRFISVNPAFTRLTGYPAEDVLGREASLLNADHLSETFHAMHHELASQGSWEGEVWFRRKDGAVFPSWESITCLAGEEATGEEAPHYIAIFNDISALKSQEDWVMWLAYHDALTELANRPLLEERCRHALVRARRNKQQLALLFIDLDDFKQVNDTHGHAMGDRLLQIVAGRLQACVREEDTVARLGGDEFTILLEEVPERADIVIVVDKLLEALHTTIEIDGHELRVGGSVGIAIFPDDGSDWDTLIGKADTAMYQAKQHQRGGYIFASPPA